MLEIEPLPCWVDQYTEEEIRGFVAELVAEIEEEGALTRRETGKRSLGGKKILRMRPHHRPVKVKKSPKPRFHAVSPEVFQRLREAYREVVGAFREASELLRAGHLGVAFPEGTFPAAQPFVPFAEHVLAHSRGQP